MSPSRSIRQCRIADSLSPPGPFEGVCCVVSPGMARGRQRWIGIAGTDEFDTWLTPFLTVTGRKTRRTWAPLYLRGLLGPGDRKSLRPMAARLGLSGHDQLQHFIASPAWNDRPLWTELARQADRLVGGSDACPVIDDTALPKKGTRSVGVARRYCGALGKQANCQSLVSLTLAQGEVPVPVGLHPFLPETWTSDPQRCVQAGVPEPATAPRRKGEIALSELDRLQAAGLRFGPVLADAGCGVGAAFRHGLDARGLRWAVGIVRNQKVYAADVQLVPPTGRARKPVPAARHLTPRPGRHDRGALGPRAGPPAARGRTRPRSLRGTLPDRAAPTRVDDVHRLRLPAAPAPRRASSDGAGER